MPATPAETDPSVCYRHPDRTSWTLCERCGRTICPECQILTPSGVRCPDCVRETGGSVQWQPASGRPAAQRKKAAARRTRSSVLAGRVGASTYPVVTITVAAIAVALWIIGFVTANAPFLALAALPESAIEVWRYVTASIAYPAFGAAVVFTVLSIGIFTYIGWSAEKQFGRTRFLVLLLVTGTGAAAISMLAGGWAAGLIGPIWGMAGAYLIVVWSHAPARNRMLIGIAVWLVISLFLGGNILALIGGTASGIGAMLLLRRYDDRGGAGRTAYLILVGGLAVLILLAVLRNTVIA